MIYVPIYLCVLFQINYMEYDVTAIEYSCVQVVIYACKIIFTMKPAIITSRVESLLHAPLKHVIACEMHFPHYHLIGKCFFHRRYMHVHLFSRLSIQNHVMIMRHLRNRIAASLNN